jgi:hypothetical protein
LGGQVRGHVRFVGEVRRDQFDVEAGVHLAEALDGELCHGDGSLSAVVGVGAGEVRQHADLDRLRSARPADDQSRGACR